MPANRISHLFGAMPSTVFVAEPPTPWQQCVAIENKLLAIESSVRDLGSRDASPEERTEQLIKWLDAIRELCDESQLLVELWYPCFRHLLDVFTPMEPLPDVGEQMLAWRRLRNIEPELIELETDVIRLAKLVSEDDADFWRVQSLWKRRLTELARWFSRRAAMRTDEAYNVAYSYLLAIYERADT